MKFFWITTFLLFLPLSRAGQAFLHPPAARERPVRVALTPLGHVTDADLGVAKRALEDYYQVQVTVTPPLTVPDDARVSGSTKSVRVQASQLRIVADTGILQAGRLLSLLADNRPKGFDKVLGITSRGIRAGREQWTIRGMANDTCSVVSTYLVRQQSPTEKFAFRLTKVARHEFGHVLGLPHCGDRPVVGMSTLPYGAGPDPSKDSLNCFMRRSTPDGVQFYATANQLCASCAEQVRNHLKPRLSP